MAKGSKEVFHPALVEFLRREIRKETSSEKMPNGLFQWDHFSKLPRNHPMWYVRASLPAVQ